MNKNIYKRIRTNIFKIFKDKFKSRDGLSLIEIIVVIAITGLSLIALLNLSTRDLKIEYENENRDNANYINVSQIEKFDMIKSYNPMCLNTLYSNPVTYYYYICQNGFSAPGLLNLISNCYNPTYNQSFDIYYSVSPENVYIATNTTGSGQGNYQCSMTMNTTGNYNLTNFKNILSIVPNSSGNFISLTSKVLYNEFNSSSLPVVITYNEIYYL